MSCQLGFEKQANYRYLPILGTVPTSVKNVAACGAFSFAHISNLYGRPWNIGDVKSPLKTSGGLFGTGMKEAFIKRGVNRKFGEYIEIYEFNELNAKNKIDRVLQSGFPILINVDETCHYMVVAANLLGKYVIIDSGGDEKKTILFYSWRQLSDRLCCDCEECDGSGVLEDDWCEDCSGTGELDEINCPSCIGKGYNKLCPTCKGKGIQYWGLGVKLDKINKNFKNYTSAGIKKITHFIKRLMNDKYLQEFWGFYLKDLTEIFDLNLVRKDVIRASDFFDKYGKQIAQMVYRWIEETDYDIKYELNNYRFVAEFYDFKFHKKDLHKVLVDFTAMFALAMVEN